MGILAALEEVKPTVPMVVRLVGTNEEEGRRLLDEAQFPEHDHGGNTGRGGAESVAAAQRAQ